MLAQLALKISVGFHRDEVTIERIFYVFIAVCLVTETKCHIEAMAFLCPLKIAFLICLNTLIPVFRVFLWSRVHDCLCDLACPCSPSEEGHLFDVAERVASLECLVVHAQLVTSLNVEENEVGQEPNHDQEQGAGENRSADRLVKPLPVHPQLHRGSKGVKRANWAEEKVFCQFYHFSYFFLD